VASAERRDRIDIETFDALTADYVQAAERVHEFISELRASASQGGLFERRQVSELNRLLQQRRKTEKLYFDWIVANTTPASGKTKVEEG
jgi:hypothetical protein